MTNISGIYKITSLIKPNRCYIGSTINIKKRWIRHLGNLKEGNHHSIKLQRHYNKYGRSDLRFSILLECEREDLIKIEQYFIDSYNPYFNNCKIAGSLFGYTCKGHKDSKETKIKKSIGKLGNKNPNFGKPTWNKGLTKETDERVRRYSENVSKTLTGYIPWNKGKKCPSPSQETIEKRKISYRKTIELRKQQNNAT